MPVRQGIQRVLVLGIVAVVAGGLAAGPAAASNHLKPQLKGGAVKGPAGPPPIKIEITDFSFSTDDPDVNAPVIIRLRMKNTGAGTVARVPWSIHYYTGNQTLAQSPDAGPIEPGQTVTKTATWTTKAGTHRFQGYVDPTGRELKNTAPVASQIKERDLNVARVTGYDLGSAECIRAGTSFGVKGSGFGPSGVRTINFGGHSKGGPLEIVSWSDTLIRATLPAATVLHAGKKWYYAGLIHYQQWVSNIDASFPGCGG